MTEAGRVPVVATLRRLLNPPAVPRTGERCELCSVPLHDGHGHIVDIRTRRLLCACRICAAASASAGGRYRAVPARYVHLPSMRMSAAQWEALAIPVDLAFFFFNSDLGRTVAFYPGPAGAAESLLPLDAWSALAEANPWIRAAAPDVEALLVRRAGEEYDCFLVPIDACYELVGRIRAQWTGLGGGERVRMEIDGFFAAIRERTGTRA
ncbi:MAG: DUF5947 family protein [Gemmatimonadota bacterium]